MERPFKVGGELLPGSDHISSLSPLLDDEERKPKHLNMACVIVRGLSISQPFFHIASLRASVTQC